MADEFDLIKKYFAPLSGDCALNLEDDAACVSSAPGFDTIVTKDLLIEGTHFLSDDPISSVAYKALAVNVSDCIAKGATPSLYWLGLAVPKSISESFFAEFSDGLAEAQSVFNCSLAGGDTTSHSRPGITISITLMGQVAAGNMIKRSGAKSGNDIYVTGTLGDAAFGLFCLQNNLKSYSPLTDLYRKPKPPIGISELVLKFATSSADVSDGLIADLSHICLASNLGAVVHEINLPLSHSAQKFIQLNPGKKPLVWSGGDDYQTLFTAPKEQRENIATSASRMGLSVSRIGSMVTERSIHLLDLNGEKMQIDQTGYTHF